MESSSNRDEVLARVDDTIASETSCFIAGTPVWTEAGEVPIESIKPGDVVLSRPEEGGEMTYRSVARTVTHTNKVIVAITYVDPEKPDRNSLTFATDNHPFWVEGRGWVAACAIRPGYELQGTNGRKIVVSAISPVYRTETPGVGWYQLDPNYGALGNDVDFNGPTWRLVKSRTSRPNEEFVDGPFLGVNVYNFEVDGFHTYYVGSSGVWVHNANCAFSRQSWRVEPTSDRLDGSDHLGSCVDGQLVVGGIWNESGWHGCPGSPDGTGRAQGLIVCLRVSPAVR